MFSIPGFNPLNQLQILNPLKTISGAYTLRNPFFRTVSQPSHHKSTVPKQRNQVFMDVGYNLESGDHHKPEIARVL